MEHRWSFVRRVPVVGGSAQRRRKSPRYPKNRRAPVNEKPEPFVLASGSPRRKILLKKVVPRFLVRVSRVPEPPPRAGVDVKRYVTGLARR
ncbi:MAG: Maf family protein, partial [Elusimicrobia bacterium]|nr:Maf family protein [Elusimicrobiota bacterium]